VLALEGHGCDRVFTDAVGSLRVRLTVTGPGGHSCATVEWRSTDQAALDRQEAALAGLATDASPGLRLEAERLDRRPAGSVPLAHPLVAAVRRAPTERIRAGSIATGAAQLRAVLQEVLD
jgi:acetylornithine deacetylase/succinyl-diaminopimelate desuccinylase-like protein